MNEHRKPKFVAKVDPLFTICNNKLIVQDKKLKTSAKLRVCVLNILSPHFKQRYTRDRFLFLVFCHL